MAIVFIIPSLEKEIEKKFKKESIEIFSLLLSLEKEPKKGKEIGHIGKVVIKEIKYKKFRFYFVTDNYKVKFLSVEKLKDLIIKFVRMSEKKDQQKTIDEIKHVLRNLGDEGF
jgi:hypothetical protein